MSASNINIVASYNVLFQPISVIGSSIDTSLNMLAFCNPQPSRNFFRQNNSVDKVVGEHWFSISDVMS